LEVDERLDIARLDLHHQPDDARGQENLYDRRQGGDESLRPAVAAVGKHVQQVADADEQEDAGITFEHLGDDRRIEVRENLVEHQLHGFHRFGTEHQPSEADQIEGEENARNTPEPPHFGSCGFGAGNDAQPELVQGQRYAVQRSPKDEAHGRPVPQTAEQHGDEQVEIGADTPLAVAAQRDIEIIAQPRGERDVPPAPEFGDRGRFVGGVEVLRKAEAQQQGDADGHIRVTREVAIDLQGVAVNSHQAFEPGVEQRLVEDTIDEVE